jgi:tripartite-type tricarboxylate transporter receptor subunit TctC
MRRPRLLIIAAILIALGGPAATQDWPTRPIILIVPFAAGGGVDVSARIQAAGLRVAKADPDGYTMLIGNSGTHAFSQALYKTPLYNSVTDFTPVGLATESPRILIARKDLPVNNLQEFIAYVKANQNSMQFGSAGVGSGTHLPCVLLNLAIGVTVTHIPYRGEGPAQQDLMGGRLDYMCSTIQTGAALAMQGAVKGIAVMSPQRVDVIPDLPTTGEQGLPGVEASVWNAFFLPPGTPDEIVHKLNRAMSDTLDDPVVSKRLRDLGLEIVAPERRTPEYLATFLPEEVERWTKVVHAAGISAN